MNAQIPTAEQFLAQREPDEDDTDLAIGPGALWQPPADPMERIADSLSRLADHFDAGQTFTAELSTTDDGWTSPEDTGVLEGLLRGASEELADLEAKHQTVLQVISDVEASLGKSKAAPALAAKAVIEAWRNPLVRVEAPECPTDADQETAEILADPDAVAAIAEAEAEPSQLEPSPVNAPLPIEGHTRVPHPDGFDFCQECSGASQQWVHWPCDTVGAVPPAPVVAGQVVDTPKQPEHNAPVEAWREYARALGYAGPEIDKANRSVIRTTLGIAHQNEGGA